MLVQCCFASAEETVEEFSNMLPNTSLTYFIKRKKYQDQILEDIDAAEEVISKSGNINLKSFDLHDNLNDKIWSDNDTLRSDIRDNLISIAHDFYDTLDIAEISDDGDPDEKPDKTFNKYIKDVLFVGSLASFNYSSYADVDLHLLMDEDKLVGNNKLALNILKKYFTECKNDWNLKHSDLKIEGYDCELYVQDVKEENASNGVYSLMQDKWLKKPEKMDTKNFDRAWVEKKALDYIEQIDNLEEIINSDSDLELVKKAKDELKKIKDKIVKGRRDSLAAGQGEMNKYNILFKILRRSGHIGKINELTVAAYDLLNSIDGDKNNLKKEGNNMNLENVTESAVDSIAEFEKMYGLNAGKALKAYLAKRTKKSVEEVLNDDDEFDKFANWAYKHLDIDVYEKFAKYDTGSFYKRTSGLLKDPEQSGDKRYDNKRGDDTRYTYEIDDVGGEFDRNDTIDWDKEFPDTQEESVMVQEDGESREFEIRRILNTRWSDPYDFDEDEPYQYRFIVSVEVGKVASFLDKALREYELTHDKEAFMDKFNRIVVMYNATEAPDEVIEDYARKILALVDVKGESIVVVEDENEDDVEPAHKARMILGAEDDGETTFVMTSNEPEEEANKVLKELGGEKWTKDPEYSYWYFLSPMKIADVQAKLKPFEATFKVEVQESKVKEDNGQQQQPQQNQQADNNANGNAQPANNNANQQPAEQQNQQTNNQSQQQTNDQSKQPTQESEGSPKITGSTWEEFLNNIDEQSVYEVDSAFRRHPNQWIELIDDTGKIYDAEVTSYSDGAFELLYSNIHPVPNTEESTKKTPINESYADDTIDNIKGVLKRYFEVDPETEEENPEFDETFTAQDAIDEIIDILY